MHRYTQRVLFEILSWLDHLFPGWSEQHEERYDYLTDESRKYWLTRIGREGHR
jgi:hypothetical protein